MAAATSHRNEAEALGQEVCGLCRKCEAAVVRQLGVHAKSLLFKATYSRLVSAQSEDGMVPDINVLVTLNLVSNTKLPKLSGRVPITATCMVTQREQTDVTHLALPVSSFESNARNVNFTREPSSLGIDPVRQLLGKLSNTKEEAHAI